MSQPAMITPTPQRMRALEQANKVRLARAELKRRIADGEISVAEVMIMRPPEVDNWTVRELLLSQRRWGSTRCRRFLERNQISELKRLGELTDRQRALLAAQLQSGCADRTERLHDGLADRTDPPHGGWADQHGRERVGSGTLQPA